jgi:hypothetical protein
VAALAQAQAHPQADDHKIVAGLMNDTFKWLGEPQALLVNGNAKGTCNATALPAGQKCTTSCGLHQQRVKPNTRYRVRVIGGTALSYLSMALEDHEMWLFEADVRSARSGDRNPLTRRVRISHRSRSRVSKWPLDSDTPS